jgi:O-antigen/teichoic acid export membrane protein
MSSPPSPDTKQQQIRRRVLVGTLSNYIGQFATFGAWFLLTPFILREVGVAMYGLWALMGSMVAYGSLLDLGIWGAIIKYTAEYRALRREEEINALIGTALSVYLVLGSIVVVVSLMAAPLIPRLFMVAEPQATTATTLFALMGSAVGITIPLMTPLAVLRGLQRYDLVNVSNVIGTVVEFVGIVTVLQVGGGIVGVVVVQLVGVVVMQIPAVIGIWRVAPAIRFHPGNARKAFVRLVLRYSAPLFAVDVAGRLQTKSDEITIGIFLPIQMVTPYALMRKLSETTHLLTKQFMKVLLPLASELNAEQDVKHLRAVYLTGTRLTFAIFLPIATVLIGLASPILHFWVGEAYTAYIPILGLLLIAGLAATSQWPIVAILQGMAKHRILGVTAMASGIANLFLSLVLVHPFGLIGVAWGTVIPTVIENWGIILPYGLRKVEVSIGVFFQTVLLPTVLPLVPMTITLYGLQTLGNPYTLLHLLGSIVLSGGVYVLFYLSSRAAQSERELLWREMRHFFA